ncbi:MAG: 23S rRNA pseudouridine(1911/1915/1917) synthase RluD [Luminiphilus sp.]|nr:23S rRNA pseudouridine(1911/1915/1917) synthase RluD [Luminiphilus sp.]
MTARVPEALHGARLDAAAASLFPAFSRSRLADWIKLGRLQRNQSAAKPRDKVAVADHITLTPEYDDRVEWAPEALPLDLLYEDDHVIVLNKPAGLVVHPAAGHHSGTLVNRLLAHAPEMASLPRGGIVHRLDKDTSGVMLAAKSTLAHKSLVAQLAERTVSRHYSAVCRGTFSGGGTIDGPIGRHPTSRIKMAVVLDGKPAVTHYRIAERFGAHTHLDVSLESGRTHQIRVHLAWRKHPLIGDPVYGGRAMRPAGSSDRLLSALQEFPRQALHARELEFLHPESNESLQFSATIPEDLAALLGCLAEEDPA